MNEQTQQDLKATLLQTDDEFISSLLSITNSKAGSTNLPPSTTSRNPNSSKKSPSRNVNCRSKTAWRTSCGAGAPTERRSAAPPEFAPSWLDRPVDGACTH